MNTCGSKVNLLSTGQWMQVPEHGVKPCFQQAENRSAEAGDAC
jgi:hypothetical protein